MGWRRFGVAAAVAIVCACGCSGGSSASGGQDAGTRPTDAGSTAFEASTSDAGVQGTRGWKTFDAGGAKLYAVWAGAATEAWAVGAAGKTLHWDGAAWTPVPTTTTKDLRAVWGIGKEAWAVGDGGTILHWDGASWSPRTGATFDLKGIWGSSHGDIWAVGGVYSTESAYVHSVDGVTWQETSSSGNLLLAISGRSATDIWAGTAFGKAYHYDGNGWTEPDPSVPSAGGADMTAICTPQDGTIYGIGPSAMFVKLPSRAWVTDTRLTGNALSCISGTTFFAAAGNDGSVTLGTWDDSDHWRTEAVGISAFRGVYALDAQDIWAVGDDVVARWH